MTTSHRQVRFGRQARFFGPSFGASLLFVLLLGMPGMLAGQDLIQTASERTISISRGSTAILSRPDSVTRLDIGDTSIADVNINPPNQVLVYARGVGSTSLIIWGRTGPPRLYTIEVIADVASLQRQVDELFPGAGLSVTSTGTSVVLSGEVRDPAVIRKALELAETQGIPVVNHVDAPAPEQILLHVEFAEVSSSMLKEVGGDLMRILNPLDLGDAIDEGNLQIETLSDGFVSLLIEGDGARLDAVIRALKTTGEYRSLAEPNLVTREGEEASFLAGGEFPFPSIQGGQAGSGAVTIQWREFGIRLNFTPTVTNSGNIRLKVAPEVSSLDFANGLTFQGYQIPALLSRKVNTDVELRPGQTLAIGGLMDNTMLTDVQKIPLLGDIPILGFFFRKEKERQNRTELLVLVTPHILDADNLPVQALPGGDPADWDWDSHIRKWMEERATGAGSGGARSRGG
jgi:pilus assembly protein CpaC